MKISLKISFRRILDEWHYLIEVKKVWVSFRSKIQNSKNAASNIAALACRIKYRRNKKLITQFACKLRDESNEPN